MNRCTKVIYLTRTFPPATKAIGRFQWIVSALSSRSHALTMSIAFTINSQTFTMTSPTSLCAIDTGTTLIGAPGSVTTALYASIPSSSPGTGQYEGYYFYPCSTPISLQLTFGGVSWSIQQSDFQAFQVSPGQCVGSVFATNSNDDDDDSGSNGPQ